MLTELICKDRFYVIGTAKQVLERLAEHTRCYNTVKEMLEKLSPST